MNRVWISVIFSFAIFNIVVSQPDVLKISLFNDFSVKTAVFTPVTEGYVLHGNDQKVDILQSNDILYFNLRGSSIYVRSRTKNYGSFNTIQLFSQHDSGTFQLKSVFPDLETRIYTGNLSFNVDFNRMLMVNEVDFDTYLAGVVETESGSTAKMEFYKAQATLCRTYAIKNLNRHIQEGFNLCDGTHCQAYKNKCFRNLSIHDAVIQTHNLVITDRDSVLITAAFHANSGGQTHSAAEVWLVDVDYLQSVNDPFSLKGRQVNWEVKINRQEWLEYLQRNGFSKISIQADLSFNQPNRQKNYQVQTFEMPLAKIRKDWNLKSTYFTVYDQTGTILIKGRGYGHGVGLSQEGAMQMAISNYKFEDILHFYFRNIKLIDYHIVKEVQPMF